MDDLVNKLKTLIKVEESKKVDTQEMYKRLFKYMILWIIIALAANYVPSSQLSTSEIIIIATIGAIAFAILDMYIPALVC